ncbi:MAG: hypothetical protein ACFB4I_18155 [Cyanophyceae cyanobacterium]
MLSKQTVDVVSCLLKRLVDNSTSKFGKERDDELDENLFLKGVNQSRLDSSQVQSSDLSNKVLELLLERTKVKPEALDLILYSCVFSDFSVSVLETALQRRVRATVATVLNLAQAIVPIYKG